MATQIPRVELAERGPQMDLAIRRTRPAAADLEREAMKRALTHKKKVRPPFPDSFPHNVWTPSDPEGTILVLSVPGIPTSTATTTVPKLCQKICTLRRTLVLGHG